MKRCPQCNRVESDDALAFCRADGTPLISDSGSITGKTGTARFSSGAMSSEIQTSLLPNRTDAQVILPTASTTVLPGAQMPFTTQGLSGTSRRRIVTAVVALSLLVALIAGYFFFLHKTSRAIQSVAAMPFVNMSGNQDVEYLSDGTKDPC